MPSTPFFIPDTSPLYAYTPAEGWVAGYRPKGDGWDQTLHRIAIPGDHISVAANITASALRFHTDPTRGDGCRYEYRLNETDWSDACVPEERKNGYAVEGLPGGTHRVELRPKTADSGMEFTGIGGELPIMQSGSATNLTIDNTSPSFVLSPSNQWTRMTSDGLVGPWANYTVKSMFDAEGLDKFYNGSMGVTTVQDAKAELTFQGEAFYVFGLAGPNSGMAEVHLDGELRQTINMTNSWQAHNALLYVGGGFDPSQTHTLSFINTQPGGQMVIDYALLTMPSSSKALDLPMIIGCSVGAAVLGLIIGFLLYVLRRRRRRHTPTRANASRMTPYVFATGLGKDGFASNASSLNHWRHRTSSTMSPVTPASGTSINPPGSGYIWGTGKPAGLELSKTHSSGAATTPPSNVGIPVSGGPRNDLNPPFNSPPPDYPEFLPYHGPVQDSPPAMTNERSEFVSSSPYSGLARSNSNQSNGRIRATTTPPPIMGSNPSASGWLHSAAGAGGRDMSRSSSRSSTGGSVSGRSPLERLNPLSARRDTQKPDYDDIALNDYYARPATATATTMAIDTPSYSESQAEAHHNRRQYDYGPLKHPSPSYTSSSHASSTTTPSTAGQPGVASHLAITPASSQSVARLWPTRDAVPSAYKTPSSYLATSRGTLDTNSTRLVTPGPTASPPGSGASGYPPGSAINMMGTESMLDLRDEPLTPADSRRGVSIKSVRSFFSGLIFAPPGSINGSTVPSTPTSQAARPDSGTLPLVLNSAGITTPISMRNGTGSGINTPTQMVPSTATRSVFSSPSTAKTMGSMFTPTGSGLRTAGFAGTPMSSSSATPLYTAGSGGGFRPVPSRSTSEGTSLTLGMGSLGQSPNMFIELNPNSPMTDSRPGSEWTATVMR